ncbi:MOS1T transposase, partial [Pseudoatta argentina]
MNKSAAEAHRILVQTYGDNALSDTTCRDWFRRFKNNDFQLEDKERSGAPKKFQDKELEQLLDMHPEKRPLYAQRHDKVILLHDNARPHVAKPVKTYLETLKWEVLPHPLYSPDIAPSDYHLFRSLAHSLCEQNCRDWFRRFKNNDFQLEDKERSGAPKKFQDEELEQLLDDDPSQTLSELGKILQVDESTVSKRLKGLGMIQKQEHWVPYELKPRDVERRFGTCELQLQRQKRKGFLAMHPEKRPLYAQRHDKVILLHDNARPHVAKPVKTYLFSGCDTTSALLNIGKLKFISTLKNRPDLQRAVQLFKVKNTAAEILVSAGELFLVALYGDNSEKCLDTLRFKRFIKAASHTKFNLAVLPPTKSSASQHVLRTYHQVQTWLGNYEDPTEWGWERTYAGLQPIRTTAPPAPHLISCKCMGSCSGSSGCRKAGLKCSAICYHCSGQTCLNSVSTTDIMQNEINDYLDDNDDDELQERNSNYDPTSLEEDDDETGPSIKTF